MIQNTQIENPEYRGEPVNKELKNGPLEQREKTDNGFFIAFLVFLGVYLLLGIFVSIKGDLKKADQGFDRSGNACGISDSTKDFQYLYSLRNSKQVYSSFYSDRQLWDCVKKCPKLGEQIECAPTNNQGTYCGTKSDYETVVKHGKYCSVVIKSALATAIAEEVQSGWNAVGESVAEKWFVFIVTTLIAIICGIIVLFWVRYAAKCMIWSSIIIFLLLLIIIGLVFVALGQKVASTSTSSTATSTGTSSAVQKGGNNLVVFGIVFWIMALIMGIIFFCLRHTINFLCGILSAASEFVRDNCSILIFPIAAGFLILVVNTLWVFVFVKSTFVGTAVPRVEAGFEHQSRVIPPSYAIGLYIFNAFAYFWIGLYILHLSQFIVCSAASIWYFSSGKDENCISKSTSRTFGFHLGSVAFGSLILAIIKFLRALTREGEENSEGGCQLICAILSCCLKCLQRIIEYLGLHAYIEVSLTGKPFCDAAKDGFYLILRNAVRFGVSIKLFEWFEFLASLYTLFLSLPISIYVIIKLVSSLYGIITFIFFAIMISGLVAYIFTGVIVFASHTVLHCYCVDVEIAEQEGGSDALFAPQVLHETIAEYRASQQDK